LYRERKKDEEDRVDGVLVLGRTVRLRMAWHSGDLYINQTGDDG